jgi:hypothetical protein
VAVSKKLFEEWKKTTPLAGVKPNVGGMHEGHGPRRSTLATDHTDSTDSFKEHASCTSS